MSLEAALTAAAFVLVTAVSVVWHLRRTAAAPEGGAAAGAPCPRCRETVSPEATTCPACGVPRQAFELVGARIVEEGDGAGDRGALHAVVRADRCVGCGTCVDACPEPGAIALSGKLAMVDKGLCAGHAECVAACPVGAIAVSGGAAVQRVEVPEVDAAFRTNVPGVYVVGELGGRGLIKNAVNEGKIAAEAVAAELATAPPRETPTDGLWDVAVVGSGPAGLSAALESHRRGLSCLVLEQGTLADTIRKYPRHLSLIHI